MARAHLRSLGTALALLVAIAGCDNPATQGVSSDSGPIAVDGGAPDLTTNNCSDVKDAVSYWLSVHQACRRDTDCSFVPTDCGLDATCGKFANGGAAGPYLESLLGAWSSCRDSACVCPSIDPTTSCNAGVCGPKAPGGRIGDSCQKDGDCTTNYCVMPPALSGFTDGYCSKIDCKTSSCPLGSTCMSYGATTLCLLDCDSTSQSTQCRPGYGCCGGGPLGSGHAWCVPSASSYCSGS